MKESLQKNKKLIISLSVVLGIVLLLIILYFTVFTLKSVEVDFRNESHIYSEESKQSIAEDSIIKKGSSIFTLSKKTITKTLEKNNPYLKIINIETVFPSKIIIHCAEREETYAVRANDTKYFICDAEFKVLNVSPSYYNSQAILFTGLENLIENTNRVNAGEFLEFSSEAEVLKSIGTSLLRANKTVVMQKSLIESIEFTSGIYYYTAKNQPYLIIKDKNGFQTNVYAIDTLLAEKFQAMFATWSNVIYNPSVFYKDELNSTNPEKKIELADIPQNYYLNYTLNVYEDNHGKLDLVISKNEA